MNEKHEERQLPHYIKKGCLIIGIFLGGSLIISIVMLKIALRDKTVLEHVIDDSYTIQVRAEGWWEYSIPVYLVVRRKKGKTLKSGSIAYYSPEDIESKELRLEIGNIDNIIFLYHRRDPNEILAMVAPEEDLIYPRIGGWDYEEIQRYYAKVDHLLNRLKIHLQNDELELSR